jgi:opacity protein-like surface antigen
MIHLGNLCLMRSFVPLAVAMILAGLVSGSAFAQNAVGGAETVERDVSGDFGGNNRAVNTGDQVFQNEAISTAAQSSTNLRFLDETALAIGPQARVVLDKFVYNADRTARRTVVAALKGALRWTSGKSQAKAYQIKTPLAAIGVRGTQFDLLVENGQETVILRDGKVRVCLAGSKDCKPLNNPGDVAYITPGIISIAPRSAPSSQQFAESCLTGTEGQCTINAAGPSIVQFASIPTTPKLGFTGLHIGITAALGKTKQSTRWSGTPSFEQSIGLGNVPRNQSSWDRNGNITVDVGYDFANGPIIFGLEGEVAAQPFVCDTQLITTVRNGGLRVSTSSRVAVKAITNIKGRIGYVFNERLMGYGVAGVSMGFTEENFKINNSLAVTGQIYDNTRNRMRLGFVVGAGAEVKLTDFISVKMEYNYYDLGTASQTIAEGSRGGGGTTGQSATARTHIRGELIKGGLTFRF